MVRSRLCLRKMSKMAMRALILVSVFWTDLVKTLPVEDMYVKFLSGNSNLKNCSNYNVSQLETDIFKGLCSLHSPSVKDFSQDQKKIIEDIKFNLTPLLCYTIFHNVYAVCHPDTKIAVKPEAKSSKSNEDFCEDIPPISLPETCTHWLDDPDYNSKDDCFLVNEVVKAVLNNNNFCKNKCLVPDPDESVPPTVNPLCEKLLDTSLILAQMAPRGPVSAEKQEKNSSSNSNIDLTPPPGLSKQDDTKIVEKVEGIEAGDNVTPKPGGSSPAVSNEDEDLEIPKVNENKKSDITNQEADPKIKSKTKGGIDAEPLVGEEVKSEADDGKSNDKSDSNEAKKPSDDHIKEEPSLPKAEKEIVETKYENNMTTGPEIDDRSSFFGYFILLSIVAIIAYLVFHNKQKILALILEGRRRQGNRRRSGGKEYRKLDSNLEDTMDPNRETSLRQVIY